MDEAGNLLAEVYEPFTEGFQSADLIEAERQLRTLGVPIPKF
jgi:hypothetical protein